MPSCQLEHGVHQQNAPADERLMEHLVASSTDELESPTLAVPGGVHASVEHIGRSPDPAAVRAVRLVDDLCVAYFVGAVMSCPAPV